MKNRLFTLCALLLALLLAFAGCTPAASDPTPAPTPEVTAAPTEAPTAAPTAEPEPASVVLTDMEGREVELPAEVNTVVSLAASTTEIVFALGAGDMLIGRDEYSNYPDEALEIPTMGGYSNPNIEAIVAADADVVLAASLQAEVIEQLESFGIPVLCITAADYEGIYTSIELVGAVCSKADEATALCATMRDSIAAVQAAAPTENQPSVYYVMSFGEYGEWSGGPGSFINTAIELAGGVPVTNDMEGTWVNPSIEQVVELDPDIILLSGYYTVEDLAASTGYADLRAVEAGNVYNINPDLVERPGPRIVDAVSEISALIAAYTPAQ